MMCRLAQGNLLLPNWEKRRPPDNQTSTRKVVRDSEPVVDDKPQFEIDLRVEGVSEEPFFTG